uniref:Uncharacterized protein n=1 Tax=Anguilla anguilla TaxID=7936 RepID=A0A0E9T079_ANGAN
MRVYLCECVSLYKQLHQNIPKLLQIKIKIRTFT